MNTINAAYQQWKEYLFPNHIDSFEDLWRLQVDFLEALSQKYNGEWKAKVLSMVANEFYEFYDGVDAVGVKVQAIDLDGLESGIWQMMFEDEEEDALVHVYFKGWEIDYLVMTG